MIFTFWEGQMPAYIKMCLETWKFDYTVLNYRNVLDYTDFDIERAKRFTFAQISDAVRAHVLRDNGGWWLDADTIIVTGKLPEENIIGDPDTRTHSTGVSHFTEDAKDFFEKWSEYQDRVIADPYSSHHWSVLVNKFTDTYVPEHEEVTIHDIRKCRPELDMVKGNSSSQSKYENFYFANRYHLADVEPIDMLVLHNSWTPHWYRRMSVESIMKDRCTMSNILREVV